MAGQTSEESQIKGQAEFRMEREAKRKNVMSKAERLKDMRAKEQVMESRYTEQEGRERDIVNIVKIHFQMFRDHFSFFCNSKLWIIHCKI